MEAGWKASEYVLALLVVGVVVVFKLNTGAAIGLGLVSAGYSIARAASKRLEAK